METIEINLGDGHVARIDAVDAHLADWGWTARVCRTNIYAERRRERGGIQSLHRAVMGEPDGIVDHIDGDGLHCCRSNLREVSPTVNRRNVAGPPRNNTSGFLGVGKTNHGKWVARIFHDGQMLNLGSFGMAEEANLMRLAAEYELWGMEPRRAAAMAPIIAMAAEMAAEAD